MTTIQDQVIKAKQAHKDMMKALKTGKKALYNIHKAAVKSFMKAARDFKKNDIKHNAQASFNVTQSYYGCCYNKQRFLMLVKDSSGLDSSDSYVNHILNTWKFNG